MAITIASLAAKLSLDTRGFVAGFATARSAASGFTAGLGNMATSAVSSFGAAIAGAVSLGATIGKLSTEMQNIDRNAKLADRLGITYESMQKLSLAATLAGADVEVLAKGMLMMGKNIGSGGKSLDQRFFEVADSIAAIPDAAVRANKAMEVFGRSGIELLNVLQAGGQGLRDSASVIDRLGLGLSRVDAGKVEAANDALEVLGTVLSGIMQKIAVEAAPTIERFANESVKAIEHLTVAMEALNLKWHQLSGFIAGAYESLKSITTLGIFGGSKPSDIVKSLTASRPGMPGGGIAEILGGASRSIAPSGAAVRGSMEAARLIQKTGGDPISMLPPLLQEAVRILKKIDGNTDENQKVGRGTGPLVVAEF